MKILSFICLALFFITACGDRSKHAFYDALQEHERQKCLQEGKKDCPRGTTYEEYKSEREKISDHEEPVQYDKYGNVK